MVNSGIGRVGGGVPSGRGSDARINGPMDRTFLFAVRTLFIFMAFFAGLVGVAGILRRERLALVIDRVAIGRVGLRGGHGSARVAGVHMFVGELRLLLRRVQRVVLACVR